MVYVLIIFISPYISAHEWHDLQVFNKVQYESFESRPFSPNDQILFDAREMDSGPQSSGPDYEKLMRRTLVVIAIMLSIKFLIPKRSQYIEAIKRKSSDPSKE